VIPVFNQSGDLMAVLDIDSEKYNDFSDTDQKHLEEIAELLKPVWD